MIWGWVCLKLDPLVRCRAPEIPSWQCGPQHPLLSKPWQLRLFPGVRGGWRCVARVVIRVPPVVLKVPCLLETASENPNLKVTSSQLG